MEISLHSWLEQFSSRVLTERSTAQRAATPRWTLTPFEERDIFKELRSALTSLDSREVDAVRLIRAISIYGGKSDLVKLIELTRTTMSVDVLCATMDAALCIGGKYAENYLGSCVTRYQDNLFSTLSRVANFDYDRLMCDSYDMMYGPPPAAPVGQQSSSVAVHSCVTQFGVCTSQELLTAVEDLAPGTKDKILTNLKPTLQLNQDAS